MKKEVYCQIIRVIDDCEWDLDEILTTLTSLFPDVTYETLRSILSQDYQRRIKKSYRYNTNDRKREQIYDSFVQRVRSGDAPGIILDIAKGNKFSPALTGRSILEESLKVTDCSKSQIAKFLKFTSLIEDRDLAYELFLANVKDDMYGRIADCIKHSIGQEYEQLIKDHLRKLDIAYLDENDLREKGYDKTPDVKLQVPIAVNGTVINWIESKALFGDEDSHNGYLKDQLWSYWNRFGPGLVIYWFGFIEELKHTNTNYILLADSFPENVVKFEP